MWSRDSRGSALVARVEADGIDPGPGADISRPTSWVVDSCCLVNMATVFEDGDVRTGVSLGGRNEADAHEEVLVVVPGHKEVSPLTGSLDRGEAGRRVFGPLRRAAGHHVRHDRGAGDQHRNPRAARPRRRPLRRGHVGQGAHRPVADDGAGTAPCVVRPPSSCHLRSSPPIFSLFSLFSPFAIISHFLPTIFAWVRCACTVLLPSSRVGRRRSEAYVVNTSSISAHLT
jgi:hypothetical protein